MSVEGEYELARRDLFQALGLYGGPRLDEFERAVRASERERLSRKESADVGDDTRAR